MDSPVDQSESGMVSLPKFYTLILCGIDISVHNWTVKVFEMHYNTKSTLQQFWL